MRASKGRTAGIVTLVAGALTLIAVLVTSGQVSAATGTVRVGSATIVPGAHRNVALEAIGMTSPGLGAWSINIGYDSSVVTAVGCTAEHGSVCNPNYGPHDVRVSGASATGMTGDTRLALVDFRCGAGQGTSNLTLTVSTLADGTLGNPQPITATVQNGTITCQPGSLTGRIKVGSASAQVGQTASVDLRSLGIPAPGLGAWTIDISYDAAIVSAVSCTAAQGGICNPAFASNAVRVAGANIAGVSGDNTLGSIVLRCGSRAASSALQLTVQVLVDSTVGSPNPIEAATENGTFTCSQQAAPTATVGLVSAGSGGSNGLGPNDPRTWLIAGLIGAGIAWLLAGLAGVSLAAAAGSGVSRAVRPLRRTDESFVPRLRARGGASNAARPMGTSSPRQSWLLIKARFAQKGVARFFRSSKDTP